VRWGEFQQHQEPLLCWREVQGPQGLSRPLHKPHTTSAQPRGWGWGAEAGGKELLTLPGACVSPRRRARQCQGWQALWWEHSQGVINNLLSQGGLLGFRITRHRRWEAQMDPPHSYFLHWQGQLWSWVGAAARASHLWASQGSLAPSWRSLHPAGTQGKGWGSNVPKIQELP